MVWRMRKTYSSLHGTSTIQIQSYVRRSLHVDSQCYFSCEKRAAIYHQTSATTSTYRWSWSVSNEKRDEFFLPPLLIPTGTVAKPSSLKIARQIQVRTPDLHYTQEKQSNHYTFVNFNAGEVDSWAHCRRQRKRFPILLEFSRIRDSLASIVLIVAAVHGVDAARTFSRPAAYGERHHHHR